MTETTKNTEETARLPEAFEPKGSYLETQKNPFKDASRTASGSERKGGMPGEMGIQGALTIRIEDFEFQSVDSPVSMHATLAIQYQPRHLTITADTVASYVAQFRYYTGTAEEAVELLARQFVEELEPLTIQITSDFAARNGVKSNPAASWVHPEFIRAQEEAQRRQRDPGLTLPPGARLS